MTTPVTVLASGEKIGAGSVLEFSLDEGTSWKVLRGLGAIPQLGSETPSKDVSDISETEPRYIDTFPENPEFELTMSRLMSDVSGETKAADQKLFITASRERKLVDIRVTYSDGLIGATKLKQLADFASEATKEDAGMYATKGRISGAISWSEVSG